jgi:hypothetical protein
MPQPAPRRQLNRTLEQPAGFLKWNADPHFQSPAHLHGAIKEGFEMVAIAKLLAMSGSRQTINDRYLSRSFCRGAGTSNECVWELVSTGA